MNAGLFLISAAILALQVLHMRILSVQMWYHHAYIVVTMAMLGFAVSGTVATLWPTSKEEAPRRIAWCSTLFGVTAVVGHVLITTIAYGETTISGFLILLSPYFFGGMVVTLVLSTTDRVSFRYFVNLLGSALGGWLFIVLIQSLGGERLLVFCAAIGPLSALFFLRGARAPKTAGVALASLAGCAVLFATQPGFLDIIIAPDKRQHLDGEIVEQRWTPLARLDLVAHPPKYPAVEPDRYQIVQDGAAGTVMPSAETWKPFAAFDSHAVAYVPAVRRLEETGRAPKVAIIGLGGGMDVRYAVEIGASRVLGLEINQEMIDITGRDYAEFNGGVYQLPGVEIVLGEGRSTLQRLGEKFDVISLAGADTYTAGAYGAFVLSESYLYTAEALDVYLDALEPGGTVGILRFYDIPPRETLRLFGMALEQLRKRGVEEPWRNVAVVRKFWMSGTVIANEPLEAADLALYAAADNPAGDLSEALYVPGLEKTNPFTELAQAFRDGTEDEFYAGYPVDVRGVTDDSPFYFNFHHVWDMAVIEDSAFAKEFNATLPIAPSILRNLLLQIGALVAVLVIAPLFLLRRSGLACENAGRHLAFFLAIGAGFMFLEISTVQKLILFLGHPTYSLTVVLFSFLFFAGLGSLASSRLIRDEVKGLRTLALVLPGLIILFALGLNLLLPGLLHLPLPARVCVAIALLAPVNFVMGMPFPVGLTRLKRLQPKLVPWAIGANGGASVIGSVLAVILAMEVGFRAVAVAALLVYIVGLLVVTTGPLGSRAATN